MLDWIWCYYVTTPKLDTNTSVLGLLFHRLAFTGERIQGERSVITFTQTHSPTEYSWAWEVYTHLHKELMIMIYHLYHTLLCYMLHCSPKSDSCAFAFLQRSICFLQLDLSQTENKYLDHPLSGLKALSVLSLYEQTATHKPTAIITEAIIIMTSKCSYMSGRLLWGGPG